MTGFLARPGAGVAPSDALYVVWIGGNDIRTAGHSNDASTASTLVINAVNAIATDIQVLINKGAHNILVPNAGDVGAIPEFTKESPASQAQLATQSAIFFNQRLDLALANILAANPGLNLDEFDFFDFSKNVAANAASLGSLIRPIRASRPTSRPMPTVSIRSRTRSPSTSSSSGITSIPPGWCRPRGPRASSRSLRDRRRSLSSRWASACSSSRDADRAASSRSFSAA